MAYETLIVETPQPGVLLIRLNRPEALNALSARLASELAAAVDAAEADASVACIVLTGSDRAFAAGADIKEMAPKSYAQVFGEDFITKDWERTASARKPVIGSAGFTTAFGSESEPQPENISAAGASASASRRVI